MNVTPGAGAPDREQLVHILAAKEAAVTVPVGVPDLGRLYHDTRERLAALLGELDGAALVTWVPACPAWLVRDVAAHLYAVCEDVLAGRLTRIATEAETAAQVARFRDWDLAGILAVWRDAAPQFERFVGARTVWPAVIDIASHEQDIRGAVGRPGARDADVIWHGADWLLARLRPPVALTVTVEDAEFQAGPQDGTELRLVTSRFEAFRWRMGRRSRAQLARLNWSGDPSPVLDHLTVFGPSVADIIE
jgi:uncharacterized protein (TIGR03083 family)